MSQYSLNNENVSLSVLAQTSLHSYLKIVAADSQYRGVLWIVQSQFLFLPFPSQTSAAPAESVSHVTSNASIIHPSSFSPVFQLPLPHASCVTLSRSSSFLSLSVCVR